ncbi:MAG: low molecular weight phosphotyrosine protein phosphatase [Bacteroidales bacterium]|nr:low molecular weight phosphotyrosine protein phosphatase [Bacteroidales bacterium]
MKILMVCMGNICRSPMAEGIMRAVLLERRINAFVDSAGTINYHEGEAPDKRAQKKMEEHGYDISMLRARPFIKEDYDKFDVIYVMDQHNFQDVISKARNENDKLKAKMIMDEVFQDKHIDIPDPYYGGEQGFEKVFQMLYKACNIIADSLSVK